MEYQNKAIVTAIGSFSAPIVIRELHRLGYGVIGTDIYEEEWLSESREVERFYQAPLASEEEAYISFLKRIIQEEKPSLLLPLIDAEVDALNRHRQELEAMGVIICMSGEEEIELLRDKFLLEKKVGGILSALEEPELKGSVRMIPTDMADQVDFETVSYPLILKPKNGRSSAGLYRIYHEDQLGFAFANIEDPTKLTDTSLSEYVVQPMIKGHVVTVDVVRNSLHQVNAVAREELIRTPNGAGLSVRVFRDENLEKFCRIFAEELNILGCVNLEFIRGEGSGVYYFIECNPRFSGGAAFSVLSGVPVVENHVKSFVGEAFEAHPSIREGYITRRYTECVM